MSDPVDARWKATATYRSECGLVDVVHYIEEIEDLQDLIERGPDWNTLINIEIVLNRTTEPGMMIKKILK